MFIDIGDNSGASGPGEIVPGPLYENQHPVLKSDQIHNVNEQPQKPGHEALEFHFADSADGARAADCCQRSPVFVLKRLD